MRWGIIGGIIVCKIVYQGHRIDLFCGINAVVRVVVYISKVVTNIIAGKDVLGLWGGILWEGGQGYLSGQPSLVEK